MNTRSSHILAKNVTLALLHTWNTQADKLGPFFFDPDHFSIKIYVRPDQFYRKKWSAGPKFSPDQNFRDSTKSIVAG